ncbi:MAG TPA: DNA polymerase [Armatimonadota bacterium]
MATALELGPEGWKPYIEALKQRPEPVLSPEEVAERDRLIAKAKEAATLLKTKYGATRVVLFGSLAHREWFDCRTDVDLAVEGIGGAALYAAWVDVDALLGGRSVDVVDIEELQGSIREAIERSGVDL